MRKKPVALAAIVASSMLLSSAFIASADVTQNEVLPPGASFSVQWKGKPPQRQDDHSRTQEELRQQASSEAKQQYEAPATLDEPPAPLAFTQPNPVTVDECRQHFDNTPSETTWYKNRHAMCATGAIQIPVLDANQKPIGLQSFRLILAGNGSNGTGNLGEREITYQYGTDQPYSTGALPPSGEVAAFSVECAPTEGPACDWDANHAFGWYPTFGELRTLPSMISPTFRFIERAPGGTGPDQTNLFALFPQIRYQLSERVTGPEFLTRCDHAVYLNNGACLFTAVEPTLSYAMADYPEYGQHVMDAQTDIAKTKPGISGKEIPGTPGTKPLTRLYAGYDKQWYDRNNSIAVSNCKQYWGDDYATNAGYRRDCDEYPFRSTHEGAAYNEMNGIQSKWSYSSRPIRSEQNQAAGRSLSRFYTDQHIIDGDAFYVTVRQ